jgi:hypothetical protein
MISMSKNAEKIFRYIILYSFNNISAGQKRAKVNIYSQPEQEMDYFWAG